jgi:hypothetical protein
MDHLIDPETFCSHTLQHEYDRCLTVGYSISDVIFVRRFSHNVKLQASAEFQRTDTVSGSFRFLKLYLLYLLARQSYSVRQRHNKLNKILWF